MPNTGYEVDSVWIDGVNNLTAVSAKRYTFENVTANHSISAAFYSVNTKLDDLDVGDGSLFPEFNHEVSSYRIVMDCGQNTITLRLKAQNKAASIKIDGETFGYIAEKTFRMTTPGQKEITVVVRAKNYQHTYYITLIRPAENLVVQVWDDVLSVISVPENNGGYTFRSCQWLENGVEMPGETGGNLYLADNPNVFTSFFSARFTTADNKQIQSCPVQLSPLSQNRLSAYPNPAQNLLTVKGSRIQAGDLLEIYDMNGQLISQHITGKQGITIDVSAFMEGIYILKINGERVKVFKKSK
jgi:uncharacterized protein YxjI